MSMEEFSQARREKLLLLRQRRTAEQNGTASSTEAVMVQRHFRNYDPLTRQMRRLTSARHLADTVEKDTANIERETMVADQRARDEDLDLHNIAPKRANWDLKRDLDKRLARLERADKHAILVLIRQRIQAQQKAAGLDANSADRNEANIAGISAEIAATATADLDPASPLTDSESSEDE